MKHGIIAGRLVIIIALVIAALVFLTVLWPAYSTLFKGAGKQTECNWNLFLATATKTVTLGFKEIPVGCQAEYVTLDEKALDKPQRLAKKRISKYHDLSDTSGYYKQARQTFKADSRGNPTYEAIDEWALDYYMAKKMQQCWDKVWHGKLDFFAQGFTGRSMCVVCSVVRYGDDLPLPLTRTDITSLYDWMNAEPYYSTTYFDYIAEGQTIQPHEATLNYDTRRPQAIVYIHAKDGYWDALLKAGAAAGAGAYAGTKIGGAAGSIVPGVGNAIGGVAGFIVGGVGGGLAGWLTDDVDDTRQLFIMPYEGLRYTCTDIIA